MLLFEPLSGVMSPAMPLLPRAARNASRVLRRARGAGKSHRGAENDGETDARQHQRIPAPQSSALPDGRGGRFFVVSSAGTVLHCNRHVSLPSFPCERLCKQARICPGFQWDKSILPLGPIPKINSLSASCAQWDVVLLN